MVVWVPHVVACVFLPCLGTSEPHLPAIGSYLGSSHSVGKYWKLGVRSRQTWLVSQLTTHGLCDLGQCARMSLCLSFPKYMMGITKTPR